MTDVDILEVLLYGKPIGTLIRLGGGQDAFFV